MGNYDDLEDKAVGLGAVLAALAGSAGVALHERAKQREKLQLELNGINSKLNQLKSNSLSRFFNSEEIERLEKRKQEILKQLN